MNRLIHKTPLQDNVVKGERKEILISQSKVTGRKRMHVAVDDRYYSYYAYDHGGERRLKLTGDNKSLDVNADFMATYTILTEPTLYPSAYMVLTNKGYTNVTEVERRTSSLVLPRCSNVTEGKHYYAGTERVAARLGGGGLNALCRAVGSDEGLQTKADLLFGQSFDQVNSRVLQENDLHCIMRNEFAKEGFGHPIGGIPNRMKAGTNLNHGRFKYMVHSMLDDFQNGQENEVYFYHSDHLGSASWITDVSGVAVQHIQYLPYGEPFINQRTSGYNERFTFTGKERDEETGYGYFGARYMDHELMTMWLSVDPLADKYPSISPYVYCAWNPVRIIDPTGDTLFALDRQSQLDIISLADIYRNRIRFDDSGVVSIDYSGMSNDDIKTMNSHPGVALIKDISDSPVKILYEATYLILCTNPDGSKTIGFMTNKRTRIFNLSRGGLDSNNDHTYLPREGYDGQVIISPNAKYYYGELQVFRTEIIGHELAENYARTAFKCNYNPNINGNTTMEKLGAHQYANQRMQNPHEEYTIRHKPLRNSQYNKIAYEYMCH